jgi:hypothetical protein
MSGSQPRPHLDAAPQARATRSTLLWSRRRPDFSSRGRGFPYRAHRTRDQLSESSPVLRCVEGSNLVAKQRSRQPTDAGRAFANFAFARHGVAAFVLRHRSTTNGRTPGSGEPVACAQNYQSADGHSRRTAAGSLNASKVPVSDIPHKMIQRLQLIMQSQRVFLGDIAIRKCKPKQDGVTDLTAVEPAAVDENDSPDALARDHADIRRAVA